MRDIPNEMAARIESGAATLCHVWRLEQADGVVMGFTDHDRDLAVDGVVEPVDLVVGDVSFISLTMILEPMSAVVSPDGLMLLLVKPQFEVGRKALGAHGVVTDPALRLQAIAGVRAAAVDLGWRMRDECDSPLPGQDGNVEHFVLLERKGR